MPTAITLGLAQLINWGVSFYLPGAFAWRIAQTTGWPQTWVFAGPSLAMLVMAAVSPLSGRWLERMGGRRVMCTGTLVCSAGCATLATSTTLVQFYAAWCLLGVGMRLSLYDAAFATLAACYGSAARRPMTQITLMGGLATTVFWPLGNWLGDTWGWRTGVLVYGLIGLLAWALLRSLPPTPSRMPAAHAARQPRSPLPWAPALLYCAVMALVSILSSGLAAHLTSLLGAHGLPVGLAALWGLGQVCARTLEWLTPRQTSAVRLNLVVGCGLPLCFALGLAGMSSMYAAGVFIFTYGALNGLATLLRAGLPLELFAHDAYARALGTLLTPAFALSAVAPWGYAVAREHWGDVAILWVSLVIGLLIAGAALTLRRLAPPTPVPQTLAETRSTS
ncbi:MFS transporter [Pandoraea communis]|uniref:MFS transporter n=1 Tax=Pandoraea communis TaxID=2508297 RepID=A0A5E4TN78_9BURK|nr:MFS transporter [Pandoraea communis]MDM8358003.1 MFS transporter [Pandoraea communis]VVD88034.1 MFS transporter [Pandoraea communis]